MVRCSAVLMWRLKRYEDHVLSVVVSNTSTDMQETKEPACLRLFLDYQGLPLLWSWMVDVPSTAIDFKTQVRLFVSESLEFTTSRYYGLLQFL